MTIKGIVFDFDGLIIDTETPEVRVWQELFERYQVEFPFEKYAREIGNTYDSDFCVHILEELVGHELDKELIYQEFKKRKITLIDQEPLCPGVLDYLQSARAMKLKIGLASSAKLEWIDYHINRQGIKEYFDGIFTREDVHAPKPDPALFSLTVETFGIAPQETIAFEDSYNGVRAAKDAGLITVAVPNPITKFFDLSRADLIMDSLADLPLAELMKKFQ
jgi:putative hydrolase of the HAD superfamily